MLGAARKPVYLDLLGRRRVHIVKHDRCVVVVVALARRRIRIADLAPALDAHGDARLLLGAQLGRLASACGRGLRCQEIKRPSQSSEAGAKNMR